MENEEERLLKEIELEALKYIDRYNCVPNQITISDRQFMIYKKLIKQGKRATVNFNGIKWQINIQCCTTVLPPLSESWGRV